jgi:hypothetical protein
MRMHKIKLMRFYHGYLYDTIGNQVVGNKRSQEDNGSLNILLSNV